MNDYSGALAKYLIRRGAKGRFYLRLAVPRPLHSAWGKRERIKALGTSDRDLAEHRAFPVLAQWREDERQALGQGGEAYAPRRVAPERELEGVAVEVGFDQMSKRLEEDRKSWRGRGADYDAGLTSREVSRRELTRRLFDDELEQWRGVADRANERRGLGLVPGTLEYDQFVRHIAEATVDAVGVFGLRHRDGDLEAGPRTEIVQKVKAVAAGKAKPGETILELFDRWSAECLAKGEKRTDTITQDRKIIVQFSEFVGKDRGVRTITPIEVAEYRNALRDLPPKWTSNKQLRGMAMRDAAVKARVLGLPQVAFTTINKHLSTISPLYTWLAEQPAWAGLVNPCNGLFHKKVKGKNPRPPFSTAVLNKILQSPLFTGFQRDGKEHLPGNMQADDWRKWIPLVAMFTGARIGEIAQLRVGDVRQDRGVWFIHITHDEDAGLTTKSKQSRPAAVHAILEKAGFLAFHARRQKEAREDPGAALFPQIEANSRGQISGKPSRWWRDYLEDIGVKDGGDGYGAHSFRHTLADRLRSEAEMLDDEIEVALGHNQKTTTSGYGELPQGTVTMFKGWMDRVRFEGVDFSHLVVCESLK